MRALNRWVVAGLLACNAVGAVAQADSGITHSGPMRAIGQAFQGADSDTLRAQRDEEGRQLEEQMRNGSRRPPSYSRR